MEGMESRHVLLAACCVCCIVIASAIGALLVYLNVKKVPPVLQDIVKSNAGTYNAAGTQKDEQVQQAALGPAVCPAHYGFYNCTDPRFNNGYSPGAAAVIDKKMGPGATLTAKHLCCKLMNALGDERPNVRSKVKSRQKLLQGLEITINVIVALLGLLLPAGVIASTAGKVVVGATGAVTEAAFTAKDIALDAMGVQPGISCQASKESSWNGMKKQIVAHDFKNEEGDMVWQLFQTDNGCPIKAGLPKEVEYAHQVGLAYADLAKVAQGYNKDVDFNQVKMLAFSDFVPSYENPNKSTIQCVNECEREGSGRFAECKCAECSRYDREGTGACMSCKQVKGSRAWTCRQEGSKDLVGGIKRCNGAGRAC